MVNYGPPEEIIQKSIDSIEIEPELLTIQRIEETIAATRKLRQNKIGALQSSLFSLQNQLNILKKEIQLIHKISDYNYEMLGKLGNGVTTIKVDDDDVFKVLKKKAVEIDSIKVSLAKNLNDLESTINSLNLNRNTLEKQLDAFRDNFNNLLDTTVDINSQDSKILKINIYRNLGLQVEGFDMANNGNGAHDQIIMYNKETDMSTILKVDDKYSDFFISNYIWDHLD